MAKHIRNLRNQKYIHHPPLLDQDFRKGNVYTIRGPRQVGKTTFLKMFTRKLLDTRPKESIFYWSCDNLNSRESLIDILVRYSDFCKAKDVSPEYILLDEITEIEHWQKAIKFVIDNDIVGESCFILTGSNAIDLKKGSERLPGRRGKHGEDLFFMPLDFREYVKLIDPDWYNDHENDTAVTLKIMGGRLREYLDRYLVTGGFPLVINEYEENGIIPPYIHEMYYSWIVGDLLKEGKNEQTFKEVIGSILLSYSTCVSWDSLAKRSSVNSHVTIGSYIELMSDIFVLFQVFYYDVHRRMTIHRKNKKIYCHDPFILNVLAVKRNISVDQEKIIEGLVGSVLKRDQMMKDLHYTSGFKETDFVIPPGKGIEVKFRNRVSKDDRLKRSELKDLIFITRDLHEDDCIPAHIYLFIEGKNN
jgi:hypothetical protein